MAQKKQEITVVLPESIADMPVQVVRREGCSEIIVEISPEEDEDKQPEQPEYALVKGLEKDSIVAFDDILWIEAKGSYTQLHLTNGKSILVSFNIAFVRKGLPGNFIQIHRSHIVNIKHVSVKIGNCLKVGNESLTIGRVYRDNFFSRCLIIGVRRPNKKTTPD